MSTPAVRPASPDPTLADLPLGEVRAVRALRAPAAAPDWAERLHDLGFVAGERVMLVARAAPGGDPLAVRVGRSTFALRRAEAACVLLEP